MSFFKIEIKGLDRVVRGLNGFRSDLRRYFQAAGREAAAEILDTEGVQEYPPATEANQPPTPYYIRGRGTQYAGGNRGESQRLGTKWYTRPSGFNTGVGNPVSYAKWVHGEQQAQAMGRIGWRKLRAVAEEKTGRIQAIYQAWVNRLIRDKGL